VSDEDAWPIERAVETALVAGLAVSGALMLGGLATVRPDVVRWGVMALLLTPVLRLAVATFAFFRERDWVFGMVSLWVLLLVGSSIAVAAWHEARPARTPAALR
jgi:uncharacterized membrane protein